jgi:hypothetical protein
MTDLMRQIGPREFTAAVEEPGLDPTPEPLADHSVRGGIEPRLPDGKPASVQVNQK